MRDILQYSAHRSLVLPSHSRCQDVEVFQRLHNVAYRLCDRERIGNAVLAGDPIDVPRPTGYEKGVRTCMTCMQL